MRSSAVTYDPNDFKDDGFTLRQVHYDPHGGIEDSHRDVVKIKS